MAPTEHLRWLDDNIRWFETIDAASLAVDVPRCPGWDVEQVVSHLAIGLGLGYRYALTAPLDADQSSAFADVPWPAQPPRGRAALDAFSVEMGACRAAFAAIDPDQPCWTYAGPGVAAFWFRRAAIETTLHRMDVAEALDRDATDLAPVRAADAIAETIEFALPLAAIITAAEPAAVSVRLRGADGVMVLGDGPVSARITGSGPSLLQTLWGRPAGGITISGDRGAANQWLGLIEAAFAGR